MIINIDLSLFRKLPIIGVLYGYYEQKEKKIIDKIIEFLCSIVEKIVNTNNYFIIVMLLLQYFSKKLILIVCIIQIGVFYGRYCRIWSLRSNLQN